MLGQRQGAEDEEALNQKAQAGAEGAQSTKGR